MGMKLMGTTYFQQIFTMSKTCIVNNNCIMLETFNISFFFLGSCVEQIGNWWRTNILIFSAGIVAWIDSILVSSLSQYAVFSGFPVLTRLMKMGGSLDFFLYKCVRWSVLSTRKNHHLELDNKYMDCSCSLQWNFSTRQTGNK